MTLESLDGVLPIYLNSFDSDAIEVLYKPCFSNSTAYYRGVGYFRSSVFRLMTDELVDFCLNGGKIRILTSTDMDPEDFLAAKEGYSLKSFYKTLEEMIEEEEISNSTKLLCALIASGHLEIKIAMVPRGHIYHDKVGFFEDENGGVVAFHGSANETLPALIKGGNVETINVIWNWHQCYQVHGQKWEDGLRSAFHSPTYSGAALLEVNSLDQKFIRRHRISTNPGDYKITISTDGLDDAQEEDTLLPELWKHQERAIAAWRVNGHFGILKHATASGKTITAFWAMKTHFDSTGDAIVLVPSQPLLRQWYEGIRRYFPEVTVGRIGDGHDDSGYLQLMRRTEDRDRFVLISTIQSISRDPRKLKLIQRATSSEESHILLIVDECHKLGADGKAPLCELTPDSALGLSATPEVYGNPAGTQRVLQLFRGNEKSIVDIYTLREALADGHLSPYFYHIQTVRLTTQEQSDYDRLRERMKRAYSRFRATEDPVDEENWSRLIYSSRRIIRGASGKIAAMSSFVRDHFEVGQRWLIYCDTLRMMDSAVAEINLLQMGVDPRIYHSEMSQLDQEQTLAAFEREGGILVAIKCLDEGVDIPSISHGIILSSTTNPREFIQRRGRLLRKHHTKEFSVVFDAFALPSSEHSEETGFILSEIIRARELSEDSLNRDSTIREIDRIIREFDIIEDSHMEQEIGGQND